MKERVGTEVKSYMNVFLWWVGVFATNAFIIHVLYHMFYSA